MSRHKNVRVRRATARRLVISIFLVLLFSKRVAATGRDSGVIEIKLDPATTTIRWTLKDLLYKVHGTFKLQNGFLRLDMNTGHAEGLVEVDATSARSVSSVHDAHLHNDVLETSKYPTMRFRPGRAYGKINVMSPQVIAVDGVFEIQGQEHPLQIHIELQRIGANYSGKTHFTIPYVAWGLKKPSTFLHHASDRIDICVEMTAPAKP